MYQIPARKLATGDKIFDVQIEGERIQRKSSTPVVKVWKHGPCITVLTSRGQVEYDQDEPVQVNAAAHKRINDN